MEHQLKFGSFLTQSDFIVTILRNITHPRVSQSLPLASMLEIALRDLDSQQTTASSVALAREVCLSSSVLPMSSSPGQGAALLDCTDLGHITDHILSILQCHLQSESLLLWRMAITCLITLSQRPEKAAALQGLLSEVTQHRQDEDCNTRTAALTVLGNTLCLSDRQTAILVALQLMEMLLTLFENKAGKASPGLRGRLCVNPLPWCSHQLTEDSSRVEDYLHQSLPYLQSPQEPLHEVAVRFLGLIGRQQADVCQKKLQVIYKALQDQANDNSLSVSSLASQTLLILESAVKQPPSGFRLQALFYQLQRAWRRGRTPALGNG
ncbi:hypothetical protein Q9966_015302 [Columba livia]|nr:hypothetical protein Q9966_015302 [Columba livia]